MATQQVDPMQAQAQNNLIRQAVVGNSVKMEQPIFSATVDPASQNVINIGSNAIRQSGLLLGFLIEVEGSLDTGDTGTATRTSFGTANLVNEIRFDDLSNYTRVQVSGRYLALLNTLRQGFGFGGVYNPNLPMGYGDNFGVFAGPATIAVDQSAVPIRQAYYLPISYSQTDLRGSIFMQSVGATCNLQITLNTAPGGTSTPALTSIYNGNNGIVYNAEGVTVKVTQIYLSQLPTSNGQPLLPPLDLDTFYDLKETTYPAVTAGQDFPMSYSNYRSFLSTIIIYEEEANDLAELADVNYFSLVSSNMTNIFKLTPEQLALRARQLIMADPPVGTYLVDTRFTPINTINFGAMQLNLNAANAGAGARTIVGYESFGRNGQIQIASSLAA